jgi:ABC-type transport system involved in multi-copper enzyme maturation permease subunit
MYLWKAWHDSRTRIVIYILAALSIGVLSGLNVIGSANWHAYFMSYHRPHFTRPPALQRAVSSFYENRDFRMDITISALRTYMFLGYRQTGAISTILLDWGFFYYGGVAMLLASLSLATSSVGTEYGAGTMNFVLTRPSPRRNFILTDWVLGLTAMVIIMGGLAFPMLPFLCLVHARGPGNVLAGLPALWALGAAIYGLSHFTTLVAGSAPKGLILSLATLLSYTFLPNALNEWWHTDALLRATEWTLRPFDYGAWPLSPFDWGAVAFWLAIAVGFLGASVVWIRFREV